MSAWTRNKGVKIMMFKSIEKITIELIKELKNILANDEVKLQIIRAELTTIRKKSKIVLWICLIGFVLSLVGVMGTSGGGFLGGASLTSLFSSSVNPALYVGKIGDKNISKRAFVTELQLQRNIEVDYKSISGANHFFENKTDKLIKQVNKYLDSRLVGPDI